MTLSRLPNFHVIFLIVVCLNGSTSTTFPAGYNIFNNPAAVITPADAYVVVGEELVLNCTLTPYFMKPLNASSLYFIMTHLGMLTSVKIHTRFQHVIDPRILQLRIPGMEKNDSGNYACLVNETSVGGSADTMLAIPASVQVDFPPDPITAVTCISDNFESMTCSWCPSTIPNMMTKWTLEWRVGTASAWSIYKFPRDVTDAKRCQFLWPSTGKGINPHISAQAFKPSSVYSLKINTISRFLAAVLTVEFTVAATHSIVKPRQVQNLAVATPSSTSLLVSWQHPVHLHPSWFQLVYELSYKAGWPNKDRVVLQLGNATSIKLTTLLPATDYNVSVRCRPLTGHYWSNSSTVRIRTPDDVPSASPAVPLGSFRVHPCRPERRNCRSVTVFWQPIAAKDHCGELHGYEVTCQGLRDGSLLELNVDVKDLSATFVDLDTHQSYVITVVTYNFVGRSPSTVLHLPPTRSMTRHPANLEAELSNDSHVITFSWSQPTIPVSNYTLLWCEGVASQTDVCQGQLHGVTIPGHVTTLERVWQVTNVYALSRNGQSGPSGMGQEWICVYDYNGLPGTPDFSFGTERGAHSLTIEWRPLGCSLETRGRVLFYRLMVEEAGESGAEPLTLSPSDSTYEISHLHPATNYTVTLTAVTRGGPGHPAYRHVTTLESRPDDPPHNLRVSQLSSTVINFTWAPSPTPNGVITVYEVIVRDGSKIVQQMLTNEAEQFIVLRDLDGYKNYTVTVVAINKVGPSREAPSISFQTPIRAAAQIHMDEIAVEPYKKTEAMVRWSCPKPRNGPISEYIIEYVTRHEDNTIDVKKTDVVSANRTQMVLSTACSSQYRLVDVRVQAVTVVRGQRLLANFSGWKRAVMCKDPGLDIYIWLIPTGYVAVLILIMTCFCVSSYRRKTHKTLDILTPGKPDTSSGTNTDHIGTFIELPSTSSCSHAVTPKRVNTCLARHTATFGTSYASNTDAVNTNNPLSSSKTTSENDIGPYCQVDMVPPDNVQYQHSGQIEENNSSGVTTTSNTDVETIQDYTMVAMNGDSPDSKTRLLATSSEGSTATDNLSEDSSGLMKDKEESSSLDGMDGYAKVKIKTSFEQLSTGEAREASVGHIIMHPV